MRRIQRLGCIAGVLVIFAHRVSADEPAAELPGDRMLKAYFRAECDRLSAACLADLPSPEQWPEHRAVMRQQLLEMLGLDPLPERTELHATVTGVTQGDGFHVERLHFQSRPRLYVTANLYLPDKIEQPLPAVLYVCGHGAVKKDGVSYGNKVGYQHHGAWFARHGFVCLALDTLQLGEIEGIHHGLYRFDMRWWMNHGYTPAGVEAWNCVRALDYLETRPEVNRERIGVTGRSGGGAYSWWIAAIDDRIKAAVPVAGITDLENHVVDGCVEGHCDCMYFVNTYGWDYPAVAALVAPRPLLLANTDRDSIFPLDGVERTYDRVLKVYELLGARNQLGLAIAAGPHEDTQDLQVPAFRWLNYHLKDGDDSLLHEPARPYFEPEQLKVFAELPSDERNTTIQEDFVQLAPPPEIPGNQTAWNTQRDGWLAAVRDKCFRGWPADGAPLNLQMVAQGERDGVRLAAYEFDVHATTRLRLYVLRLVDTAQVGRATLRVADGSSWNAALPALAAAFPAPFAGEPLPDGDAESWRQLAAQVGQGADVIAYCCPRGIGYSRWMGDEVARRHIERRFYLLGQTLDGMQVYDIRRAVQAMKAILAPEKDALLTLHASGQMAGNSLYAALFEPGVKRLELAELPTTHREGPYYLNVQRIWDLPQAIAVASERMQLDLADPQAPVASFSRGVAKALGWHGHSQP